MFGSINQCLDAYTQTPVSEVDKHLLLAIENLELSITFCQVQLAVLTVGLVIWLVLVFSGAEEGTVLDRSGGFGFETEETITKQHTQTLVK